MQRVNIYRLNKTTIQVKQQFYDFYLDPVSNNFLSKNFSILQLETSESLNKHLTRNIQ